MFISFTKQGLGHLNYELDVGREQPFLQSRENKLLFNMFFDCQEYEQSHTFTEF